MNSSTEMVARNILGNYQEVETVFNPMNCYSLVYELYFVEYPLSGGKFEYSVVCVYLLHYVILPMVKTP